jgi:hypothetical protein
LRRYSHAATRKRLFCAIRSWGKPLCWLTYCINRCFPRLSFSARAGQIRVTENRGVAVQKSQELLDLATRFREFALQTSLDNYAAQMLRTASDLESYAVAQREKMMAERPKRVA